MKFETTIKEGMYLKPLTISLVVILTIVSISTLAIPSEAAATTLKVTPVRGIIGTNATFTGKGYTPNSMVTIGGLFTASCPTNSTGGFSNCFALVPDVGPGSYNVTSSSSSGATTAKFTVGSRAHVTIKPISGAVGSTVTITGTHFGESTKLTVTFNGKKVATNPTSATTSSTGTFTLTFVVPNLAAKAYVVSVNDSLSYVAKSVYTIS